MAGSGVDAQVVVLQEHARRRLLLPVIVLACVALTWSVAGNGWWGPLEAARPADHFGPGPGGMAGGLMDGVDVGATVFASMVSSQDPVRIDKVHLEVDESSAVAVTGVLACRRAKGAPFIGAIWGEPLSNYCESVHDATDVMLGPTADGGEVYVLAVVQVLQPGRVFVNGARVTRSGRLFDRVEHTGTGLEILVR